MTTGKSQKHRSELICSALRSAILERILLPGMKLTEDLLGERFGASRTLVRQALERLAAEGLVELRRNRGAAVATPSLEEARDLFHVAQQDRAFAELRHENMKLGREPDRDRLRTVFGGEKAEPAEPLVAEAR
jgi:DNA-binding GntR family transcriptional regulator